MDTTLNPSNENHGKPLDLSDDKSEIMRFFENHVKDAYWAYRDLIKAILETENKA